MMELLIEDSLIGIGGIRASPGLDALAGDVGRYVQVEDMETTIQTRCQGTRGVSIPAFQKRGIEDDGPARGQGRPGQLEQPVIGRSRCIAGI